MREYKFYTSREDFHSHRSNTIGSSDIVVLAGLNSFKTPYDLWKEKTGRAFDKQNDDRPDLYIGHRIEGLILAREIEAMEEDKEISEKFLIDFYSSGRIAERDKWKPSTPYLPFTYFNHPEYPYCSGSPDCVKDDGSLLIEAKSGKRYANLERDYFEGYNPEGHTDCDVPSRVYLQTQWQSFVSGIDKIHVRAWIDTNTECWARYEASREIQEKLLLLADQFMECVKKDIPPCPSNFSDISDIFKDSKNEIVFVGGEEAEKLTIFFNKKKLLSKAIKEAEKEIEDIKNAFALRLGDNKVLQLTTGQKIATQVISENLFTMIHPGKMEKENPEIFQALKDAGYIKTHNRRYIL